MRFDRANLDIIKGEEILVFSRWWAVVLLCLPALWTGCSSPRPVKAASVKPDNERKAAPNFELKDTNGKTVRLADYAGKVVLLDFWATWCGPCKIEIPWFMEFERSYKDRGFAVIGVSMDESWDLVKPFLSEMKINYRIVLGNDTIAQQYGGIEALPTTFLIDKQGKIAAAHVGLASKPVIENGIEQLLQSAADGATKAGAPPVSARLIRTN
jgi:peroxiredoxin